MRVVYGLTNYKPQTIKPVVALGVFDGLHRGHQRIIAGLIRAARKFNTQSLIVTFYPHPQKERNLYSLAHRLKLFKELGVDLCLVIRFTSSLRRISAETFLQRILIKKINPVIVFIGRNFTFGRYAEGNWQMLKDYSRKAIFKLRIVNILTHKGRPISSSYIRTLIKGGRFTLAQELLGRPVTVCGRIIRGSRLGRILGYPTANVDPDHEILPPFGVYAVRVRLIDRFFNGVCYIGNKPTVNPMRKKSIARKVPSGGIRAANKTNIEVHIFNFKNNLYRRKIQIELIRRIRCEKRFSSIQALTRQIKRDIRLCSQQIER